jgi:hypothetical protein
MASNADITEKDHLWMGTNLSAIDMHCIGKGIVKMERSYIDAGSLE